MKRAVLFCVTMGRRPTRFETSTSPAWTKNSPNNKALSLIFVARSRRVRVGPIFRGNWRECCLVLAMDAPFLLRRA